jgi:hypothetical protein
MSSIASCNEVATPASLYRYFDRNGTLIYVGVTKRGIRRNLEHAFDKEWWPHVHHQKVTHFDTYAQALAAEKAAIQEYRPPFNVQHNPSHAGMRTAYLESSNFTPPDETAVEQRRKLQWNAIPLELAGENDREFLFRTLPEHFPLTSTLRFERYIPVRIQMGGKKIGTVQAMARVGYYLFIRTILQGGPVVGGAYAKVKMVDLKEPVRSRITQFWIVSEGNQ